MTTRPCVTCRRLFTPVGKARYCSQACRCGTDAGYNAGCGCDRCKRAHARNHKRLRYRANPPIPALGTHRRIQALACLGWSTAELSRLLGKHRSYVRKVTLSDTLEPATVALIGGLYERLCMTRCTTPTAGRTAAFARARGWLPPLAWDDIDDPDETPADWEYVPPTRAEIIVELHAQGAGVSRVCTALRVSKDSLQKWCSTHDLSHIYRELAAREVRYVNQYGTELEAAS